MLTSLAISPRSGGRAVSTLSACGRSRTAGTFRGAWSRHCWRPALPLRRPDREKRKQRRRDTSGDEAEATRILDRTISCRHNCGVSTEPLRTARDHLSELIDRVEREHDRIVITRNGRDAAVLISPEDLRQLEETLSVLSDPDALADIREADAAYQRGDVIRGIDAVRRLRQ